MEVINFMSENLTNLNFEDGLKRYKINGDENNIIAFNPSDVAILKRLEKTQETLKDKEKEYDSGNISAEALDKEVKRLIDYVFNAKIADQIFKGANCISPCLNGHLMIINFFNALAPQLKKDVNEAIKKTGQNIEAYTSQVVDE
jgi:hypothetical protein